jgi:nucleoside phosphorylase
MCTQLLRGHFENIELTLLVGICGAMSQNIEADEPIYLGDVIVGTRVWRYLHEARSNQLGQDGGVQLELRNLATETTSQRIKQLAKLSMAAKFREEVIDLSFSYLEDLQRQRKGAKYRYPGYEKDKHYRRDSIHRHRSENLLCSCVSPGNSSCQKAKGTPCKDLVCDIERVRAQLEELHDLEEPPKPNIHVGTIASADIVMRAAPEFDENFRTFNVLGVDMEGGGVSKATDCIVIKGAVDYADTHKNKDFKYYSAAAAASVAKAFLMKLYRGTTSM